VTVVEPGHGSGCPAGRPSSPRSRWTCSSILGDTVTIVNSRSTEAGAIKLPATGPRATVSSARVRAWSVSSRSSKRRTSSPTVVTVLL